MAASFFALLDDIAVLAKAAAASIDDVVAGAAKASAKAAGVVIDDAAVTPQYVKGISPQRELPIIWRITRGSLVNKALIIALALPLSIWAPWVFPWLLVIGGSYLVYEGAEKVWHWIQAARGAEHEATTDEVTHRSAADEKQVVGSAVRTDLVLSTEIMLISLANIEATEWGMRLAVLVLVAVLMTVGVYGAVALLVKMDDVGLWLLRKRPRAAKRVGLGLIHAMPWVFRALSVLGVVAMLWVGGHILLTNLAEIGLPWPLEAAHGIEHAVHGPAFVSWLIENGLSAVLGLVWGAVLVALASVLRVVVGRRDTVKG
ncbi:MAG: DUF808 domain-containing protein [Actinobacteria bacterium]|nr:DUF808 domain-containing protein [Actinomycetota bacterium]